jgi:hypothetical protein
MLVEKLYYQNMSTMKRRSTMKRAWAVVMVLSLLVVLSGCMMSQNKPSGVITETSSITATVVKIDYSTRTVSLRGPKGDMMVIKVGDEARNFNQLKVGDIVTFVYSDTMAIDVQPARGDRPMATQQTELLSRAPLGDKPGGVIRTTGVMTATVVGINYTSREIWLQVPDGNVMKIVAGPGVQRFDDVRKGDMVVFQYIATLTITVQSR